MLLAKHFLLANLETSPRITASLLVACLCLCLCLFDFQKMLLLKNKVTEAFLWHGSIEQKTHRAATKDTDTHYPPTHSHVHQSTETVNPPSCCVP